MAKERSAENLRVTHPDRNTPRVKSGMCFEFPSCRASSHCSSILRGRGSPRNGHDGHDSFGDPANSESPVALRPPLARGLPLSTAFKSKTAVLFRPSQWVVPNTAAFNQLATGEQPTARESSQIVHRATHTGARSPPGSTSSAAATRGGGRRVQQPFGNLIEPRARPRRRAGSRRSSWAGGR
jgi:hypothetical protein